MDYHYVFTLAGRFGPVTAEGVITFRGGTTYSDRYRAARERAVEQASEGGAPLLEPGVVTFYTLVENS